ncbi:hypothetical protein D9758_000387 [Tetrapyrgos nigripes]|uniref:RNA helicase n=1 Tax=Tetrapyrgos nigripes TaxID=182062 RepID=A0A8H5H1B9_9AGAR|nr:hypothetical protein D9758_000387 [Tetrapyrgos nigripes]
MKIFSSSSCLRLRHLLRKPTRRSEGTRWISLTTDTQTTTPVSFTDLGIRRPLVKAILAGFPNVQEPTRIQAELIPAILSGKDVLLQDDTGVGKSFGLMLALLNKTRLHYTDPEHGQLKPKPSITSLLLVPHRDLAFQFLYWIRRVVDASSERPTPLQEVAQVVVRNNKIHLDETLSLLRETPPHVLIGTPAAVLEIWRKDPSAIRLEELSSIALDDVDYMIETVPSEGDSVALRKARKKITMHPGPARDFLETIYADRRQRPDIAEMDDVEGVPGPQLIVASATLRRHLKNYLFHESGLLNKGTVKVRGSVMAHRAPTKEDVAVNHKISHSILVASYEGIKNTSAAVEEKVEMVDPDPAIEVSLMDNAEVTKLDGDDSEQTERERKFSTIPSPFNQDVLEAVAAAFALDVPSVALLTIPSDASVHRAVYDLRALGVNAHAMNFLVDSESKSHLIHGGAGKTQNPTLFVATPATIRGVDMPSLSHVFIMGAEPLQERWLSAIDTYIHVAGRVGRFGRKGKVVSVVPSEEEAERIDIILKRLGVCPVRFTHFR